MSSKPGSAGLCALWAENATAKHRCSYIAPFDNIYEMPKQSIALVELPPIVRAQLRELGENLTIARKRRRESRKDWAARIGVSVPTLIRMEKGDPGVAMGTLATALWMMGRIQALPELAAPQLDHGALEREVRLAKQTTSSSTRQASNPDDTTPRPGAKASPSW
ncbi:helix-turn-helix domain-containing protein [Inhella gelatinilytica]|uniref:Helix-turn-helix transcriptional regulator n=1 Tax=Inhella gelatinilytica TaxID=2795030 RepID=A0A931IX95_9BURK|nr:helix-turn-helix transcriptional regulator [Inhella gelatinilytica]MBH9553587.1 helix-turn-helix transcriptional regulator [Inhella gelatinilytica]